MESTRSTRSTSSTDAQGSNANSQLQVNMSGTQSLTEMQRAEGKKKAPKRKQYGHLPTLKIESLDEAAAPEMLDSEDVDGMVSVTRELPKQKDGTYIVRDRQLFLTFSQCSTNSKEIKSMICRVFKVSAPLIVTAEEEHKNGGVHTHALVDMGQSVFKRNLHLSDMRVGTPPTHPNIQPLKGRKALSWDICIAYMSKTKANRHLMSPGVKHNITIWQAENLQMALSQGAMVGARATDTMILWENRPREVMEIKNCERPDYKWIDTFDAVVKDQMGRLDRHINWFADRDGHKGKSALCRWLRKRAIERDEHGILVKKMAGKLSDFVNDIATAQDMGWTAEAFVLDLPRGYKDRECIYPCLEVIKDAWADTPKYKGRVVNLPDIPVVCVFANWWPDFWQMSMDRWNLFNIVDVDRCEVVTREQAYCLQGIWDHEQAVAKARLERELKEFMEKAGRDTTLLIGKPYGDIKAIEWTPENLPWPPTTTGGYIDPSQSQDHQRTTEATTPTSTLAPSIQERI